MDLVEIVQGIVRIACVPYVPVLFNNERRVRFPSFGGTRLLKIEI
jgi:hypothetical protein